MSDYAWEKQGGYEVARTKRQILARSPSFDEGLRGFARSLRARWDGLEKAWVFPQAREADLLHGLEKMTAEKEAKAAQNTIDSALIADRLRTEPFSFHGPKLDIRLDDAGEHFVVRFPYNEDLSAMMRSAGGRWSGESRAYLAPLSALNILEKIAVEPRREAELFASRNEPDRFREVRAPLAEWLAVLQSPAEGTATRAKNVEALELKVIADTVELTYKATFPFPIDSPLGSEIIRPALFEADLLDKVRPEDLDRSYPRINLNSAVFEMCRRDALETALARVASSIADLGECSKIEISAASSEGQRWRSHNIEPMAGEVALRGGKAWLIAKASRSKNKTTLRAYPLGAQQAHERLEALGATGKWRSCAMAGIDIPELGPYVEALFLGEASAPRQPRAEAARKMRL